MNDATPGQTYETFDIQRLLELLPHRYPMLLVDRIVEARGDEYGVGIKNVTANEPHFQGHFPENPVMPGVLMLEALTQAGAWLVRVSEDFIHSIVVLKQANNVPGCHAPSQAAQHRTDFRTTWTVAPCTR